MGYQIQYRQTVVKTYVPEYKKLKRSRKYVKFLIVGIVLLFAIFFGGKETVQDFLLPGNSRVTRAAVSKMVTDLIDGELLTDSLEVFCREIVNGAHIPE